MDRPPKPAPFKAGARVRYIGERRSWCIDPVTRAEVPMSYPGMEIVIDHTRSGKQGTLRHLRDEDGPMYDDMGDPVLDNTTDGYSVYYIQLSQQREGRIIWPEYSAEWELVAECKHKFVIPSCMSGDGPYCEVCGVSLYEAPASGK